MDKIISRYILFWVAILATFILFFYLFYDDLVPFFVGLVFAYIVRPMALKMYGLGFNKSFVSILLTVLIFVVMMVVFLLGIPLLSSEIARFVSGLGEVFEVLRLWLDESFHFFDGIANKLDLDVISMIKDNLTEALRGFLSYLLDIVSGISNFLSILLTVFLTPIACFYFLRDWDKAFASLRDLLPLSYKDEILSFLSRVDINLSNFIRGQLGVCVVLACYYSILLSLIGVKFGLLLGLMVGFLSILPYVGFSIGVGLTFLLSFMQFFYPDGIEGLIFPLSLVVLVFVVGQVFESFWLSPVMIGDRVNLHPLWIIFALLAGGGLGGFLGVLLAIPGAIVIRESLFLLLLFYRKSIFYGKA